MLKVAFYSIFYTKKSIFTNLDHIPQYQQKKTVCDITSQVVGPLFTGDHYLQVALNDLGTVYWKKILNTENKCHENILLIKEI